MKQHITPEQWAELTDAEQKVLHDWWEPKEYDVAIANGDYEFCVTTRYKAHQGELLEYGADYGESFKKENCIPLFSIGQLIEFIGDDWLCCVTIGGLEQEVFRNYEGELIEALWKAIKAKLKASK